VKLRAISVTICDTSADVAATNFMHIIVVAENVRDDLVSITLSSSQAGLRTGLRPGWSYLDMSR